MPDDIDTQIQGLQQMTVKELRQYYARLFDEVTPCRVRSRLISRIAWKLQEQRFGGIPASVEHQALVLARKAQLRLTAPKRPRKHKRQADPVLQQPPILKHLKVGTIINRIYKGQTYTARITPEGIRWNGHTFQSLSALAKAITGTHWNGWKFFNLEKPAKEA